MSLSVETLCEDCGHRRLAHLDTERPSGVGACHHGYAGAECQCANYARPIHEGSDIRDVEEGTASERAARASEAFEAARAAIVPNNSQLVYDASVDTIVSDPTPIERVKAEKTMTAATDILEGNTESLSPDQLNLDRISLQKGQRILLKDQEENEIVKNGIHVVGDGQRTVHGEEVLDGSVWWPSGDSTSAVIWLDGAWRTPDDYNILLNAKRLQEELDDQDENFEVFSFQNEDAEEDDPVNHPSHYTAYPGVEVIQLTRWMSFNLGNAVKYIARAGLKDSDKEIQDLEKAVWYIKDEIARKKGEYGEQKV